MWLNVLVYVVIPDYQSCMLPLLEFACDNREHSLRDAIKHVSDVFSLSDFERKELFPSGKQVIIDNRVGWARTYLKKAGLVVTPRRGYFKITQRGLDALKEKPRKIDNKYLKQFPEFVVFTKTRARART